MPWRHHDLADGRIVSPDGGKRVQESLRRLRQLLAGGDASVGVASQTGVAQERAVVQLINGYGPSENTTFTCCHRGMLRWDSERSVPINQPVARPTVLYS